jgi:hypothetical protein
MGLRLESRSWSIFCVLATAASFGLSACAAKKAPLWGDPQSGLILTYRMPEKEALNYRFLSDQTPNLEAMGQSITTESQVTIGFLVQTKGMKENHHLLGLTIKEMKADIKSPQGPLSPDLSAIIGKGFDMTMTNLGKEMELSGAASIQYDLGPSGKRNLASVFQAFFPDLPGRAVRIGDTWTAEDLITDKAEGVEIRIRMKNEHKLEGFETVAGLDCARIGTAVTGTLEGEGEQQGMRMIFKGDIKGTDTWYFAYREGFYVRLVSSASVDGKVEASGLQSMTIPLTQKIKMETNLLRSE